MTLDRKKRIILFVVLTCIYFLFFNVFTFKVHALEQNISYLQLCTEYTGDSQFPSYGCTNYMDLTTFKISDEYNTDEDFSYNVVNNYTGQADNRTRYFGIHMGSSSDSYLKPITNHYIVFSVYSRIPLEGVYPVLQGTSNNLISESSYEFAMTDNVTLSDSPHYFYTFYINTFDNDLYIQKVGIRFTNNDDKLYSPIAFGFTNIFTFDNQEGATEIYNQINTITEGLNNQDVSEIDKILSPNVDNIDSQLGGFNSSINGGMSNTPVSGLVTLPITFLTAVSNSMVGECSAVNYFELFDYTLMLPCPRLDLRLGAVWNIIDTIFSLMLIYSIGKSLVRTFARLSDMDTNIMYECYSEGMRIRGRDKE